ncbi:MAG: hypothetical protein E7497_07445 [Ruminococcus sp.]|nr:hypothetical protein [Ruminococcus sp.]
MTDKEMRKLKRPELLEIMYYLQKEVEELRTENESLKNKLENAKCEISSENLEKIVNAVKEAVGEQLGGQSADKPEASENGEQEKDE